VSTFIAAPQLRELQLSLGGARPCGKILKRKKERERDSVAPLSEAKAVISNSDDGEESVEKFAARDVKVT